MRGLAVVVVLLVAACTSIAAGISADYLTVEEQKVSPAGVARIGDPVAVEVVLKKLGPEPQEARLNLSIGVDDPTTTIVFDGGEAKTYYGREIEVTLPKGLKQVSIKMVGSAPPVSRLTRIEVVRVSTYVYYDEENRGYQEEATLYLDVTNELISAALSEIARAEAKLSEAEQLVAQLEEKGVEVESLKKRLETAKSSLATAKELHDRGNVDLAKQNAENSIALLEDIIKEAREKAQALEKKSSLKKYLIAIAGIIVIALVVFFIRQRKEELG
ncbi:MAG: hypothetical protein GXO66_08250 [Euryarchaeota archaeon]|nr:hypothetical protein [Euryarchaeota archaeon]